MAENVERRLRNPHSLPIAQGNTTDTCISNSIELNTTQRDSIKKWVRDKVVLKCVNTELKIPIHCENTNF